MPTGAPADRYEIDEDVEATLNITIAGSSDSEVKALTVSPTSLPPSCVVTMVTPEGKVPTASFNCSPVSVRSALVLGLVFSRVLSGGSGVGPGAAELPLELGLGWRRDGNECSFPETTGCRGALGVTGTTRDTDLQGRGRGGNLGGCQTQFQHIHAWHGSTLVDGSGVTLLGDDQVGDTLAHLRHIITEHLVDTGQTRGCDLDGSICHTQAFRDLQCHEGWTHGIDEPHEVTGEHLRLGDEDISRVPPGAPPSKAMRASSWIFCRVSRSTSPSMGTLTLTSLRRVLFGLLPGRVKVLRWVLGPLIQILRPVSPLAWLPIGLALLLDAERTAVFVIVISALWPILINTIDAVLHIHPTYLKLTYTLGTPLRLAITHVWLPATLPGIIIGLRLSLFTSWLVIIVKRSAMTNSITIDQITRSYGSTRIISPTTVVSCPDSSSPHSAPRAVVNPPSCP